MNQFKDYIAMGAEHMSEKKSAVGWIMEMATIIGIFLICFLFLHNQIEKLDEKLEKQGQRTDKLYEMYCEANQKIYDLRKDMDQRFYDLLKEQKNNKDG